MTVVYLVEKWEPLWADNLVDVKAVRMVVWKAVKIK